MLNWCLTTVAFRQFHLLIVFVCQTSNFRNPNVERKSNPTLVSQSHACHKRKTDFGKSWSWKFDLQRIRRKSYGNSQSHTTSFQVMHVQISTCMCKKIFCVHDFFVFLNTAMIHWFFWIEQIWNIGYIIIVLSSLQILTIQIMFNLRVFGFINMKLFSILIDLEYK